MNLKELRSKRDRILDLAAKHGATNVRVFGSVARNEAQPGSDVDFLIDVADYSRFEWGGGGLLVDLEDLLGCDIDLVTEKGLHWYLRDRILQEAVAL
jgi:hypothetical protein